MAGIVNPDVEQYALEHTCPPGDFLSGVAERTRAEFADRSGMMVGTLEGRFLELLVYGMRARRILEIGAFTGYSSISMAAGMPRDGRIITCELSPEHAAVARRHIEASGYGDRIELREGRALETIASLEGPFDFVFIDADKPSYIDYYEATLGKLAPAGLLAADNTLWGGRVADSGDQSENTVAIRRFNDHVRSDPVGRLCPADDPRRADAHPPRRRRGCLTGPMDPSLMPLPVGIAPPPDLVHRYTSLDLGARLHLERLMASWSLLADFSFSDLLLFVSVTSDLGLGGEPAQAVSPSAGEGEPSLDAADAGGGHGAVAPETEEGGKDSGDTASANARDAGPWAFVVIGQIRPTTSQTLYEVDLVGQVQSVQRLPKVIEAYRTGVIVRGEEASEMAEGNGAHHQHPRAPSRARGRRLMPGLVAADDPAPRHARAGVPRAVREAVGDGHRRAVPLRRRRRRGRGGSPGR